MTEDGVGKIGASTRQPRGWEVRGRSVRPASALNGGRGGWRLDEAQTQRCLNDAQHRYQGSE